MFKFRHICIYPEITKYTCRHPEKTTIKISKLLDGRQTKKYKNTTYKVKNSIYVETKSNKDVPQKKLPQ